MMVSLQSNIRRGLRRLTEDVRLRTGAAGAACGMLGLVLSGASLGGTPQAFVAAAVLTFPPGWKGAAVAVGGCAGYLLHWQMRGLLPLAWTVLALAVAVTGLVRERAVAAAVFAGAIVAVSTTVSALIWKKMDHWALYVLTVACAMGSGWVFARLQREPWCRWCAAAIGVLALAQCAITPWFNFGMAAGAAVGVLGALPGVALAGIALDLAQITPVPMTAALCLSYLPRMVPGLPRYVTALLPASGYLLIMPLSGTWDYTPLPGLLAGGIAATALFRDHVPAKPRSTTADIQVRLEIASQALSRTEQLLIQATDPPVDASALLEQALTGACTGCPCRKTCHDRERLSTLSPGLLEEALPPMGELGFSCRKTSRVWEQLRRGREQLRNLQAQRLRQGEYRAALGEQYRFLAAFLQELTDHLAFPEKNAPVRFDVEFACATTGKELANGDCCRSFSGVGCRQYICLCDGMGTGLGAREDGEMALNLLQKLLQAGYPPADALVSLNSLTILLGRSGAATVDLAEIDLSSGRVMLYKWGAAPSYLFADGQTQQIGTPDPPPGVKIGDGRSGIRLSLRRGEVLVLLSDGAEGGGAAPEPGQPLPEYARSLVGRGRPSDDATAAVVRLKPVSVRKKAAV